MSDFDLVLERLLTDPAFAAALASNRVAALAGYDLDVQELELLSAQVGGDAGGEHVVETRESKASMFGLLAPLVGAAGFGPAPVPASEGFGAAAQAGFGPATDAAGADVAIGEGFGAPGDSSGTLLDSGFGESPDGDTTGSLIGSELSDLIGQDMPTLDEPPADPNAMPTGPPETDYRTRVDVNGDGRWDQHAYRERADGGVDIMADMNHDGTADWIAIDYDRDGLVDQADWDRDKDGRFETHFFDDDGDGWLDRKIESPEG